MTLPETRATHEASGRVITLRIPDSGGHPQPGSRLPRGTLLLTVLRARQADDGIELWEPEEASAEGADWPVWSTGPSPSWRPWLTLVATLLATALIVLLLRLAGCG